ncbi:MAG: hypothetical protein ACRC6O_13255 [Flavobacterium sp.]
MKIKSKFIFILILFTGCPVYAGFQIGASINYLNINDDYEYNNSFGKPSLNYGYNYAYKPLVISVITNRLVNQSNSENVKRNGLTFESKTKITADTLTLGYQLNRFIPYVFLTNAGVEKSLYRDKFLGKTEQYSILSGFGTTYLYNKDFNFNASLLTPNKEQGLEYGVNFSINYNL